MDKNEYTKGRRRVPRRIYKATVGLLIQGQYSVTQAFQLGEGGILLAHDGELSKGQKLVVTFKLPKTDPVLVRGVVRYCLPEDKDLPQRYGVEFLNLDFKAKREIRSFVASKVDEDYQDNKAA